MGLSQQPPQSNERSPQVFVLMPFSEENEWLFYEVLAPTIRELGLEPIRADTSLDQQNILKDIVAGIMASSIVVADITGLNPNVMYELGMAHGLQKPTIILTQSVSSAPFDLRPYRMLPYSSHFQDANRLMTQLKDIISQAREGKVSFGNPISDFGVGIPSNAALPEIVARQLSTPLVDDVPAGFLDYIDEVNSATTAATQAAERIAHSTVELGFDIESRGARLKTIDKNDSNSYKQVRGVVASASQVIGKWTSEVNEEADILARGLLALESGTDGLLQTMPDSSSNLESLSELADALRLFDSQLGEAMEGLEGMRDSMLSLPGISRDFGRVTPPAIGALNRVLESMLVARAFASRTVSAIEERLAQQES